MDKNIVIKNMHVKRNTILSFIYSIIVFICVRSCSILSYFLILTLYLFHILIRNLYSISGQIFANLYNILLIIFNEIMSTFINILHHTHKPNKYFSHIIPIPTLQLSVSKVVVVAIPCMKELIFEIDNTN